MLKHIRHLFLVSSYLIAISVTIGIAILSLINLNLQAADAKILNFDKVLHAFAYGTLSLFWLIATQKLNKQFIVLSSCVIYGTVIEFLQSELTNYRTGDLYDVLANTLGVIFGYLFFEKLAKNYLLK